jgi:transcription initiation factor TFIIH subunit 3
MDNPSLLVVIVDMNTIAWSKRDQETEQNKELISFCTLIEHVIIFLNAYLMQSRSNYVSIISNNLQNSNFIYPTQEMELNEVKHNEFHVVRENLIKSTKEVMSAPFNPKKSTPNLSAALSLALCYINRVQQQLAPSFTTESEHTTKSDSKSNNKAQTTSLDSRILILQITPDISSQYIPIMNCIFSAQKLGVLCDAMVLSSVDSTFLQQAADLTNGIYYRLEKNEQKALLQYAITLFLHDRSTRSMLNLPVLTEVDFKASCFCHKKTTDIGYICSVCLSIFCKFVPVCKTCDTKFILPKISVERKKNPLSKSNSQSSMEIEDYSMNNNNNNNNNYNGNHNDQEMDD